MSKKNPDQKKKADSPPQEFFRRIDEPIVLRRSVLEASKSTLSLIKGIYTIQDIRQKKFDKLAELQKSVREVRLLIQKAEEVIPKYTRNEAIKMFPHLARSKPVQAPVQQQKQPEPEPVVQPKKMTEIEKLNESINKIDEKINRLPGVPKSAAKQASTVTSTQQDDLGAELGKALERIHKKLKEL